MLSTYKQTQDKEDYLQKLTEIDRTRSTLAVSPPFPPPSPPTHLPRKLPRKLGRPLHLGRSDRSGLARGAIGDGLVDGCRSRGRADGELFAVGAAD